MDECDVTTLSSAKQALHLIEEGQRFDAILCDLMMPELSGSALFHELSEKVPEQAERMIFMTGGAYTEQSRTFLATTKNTTVPKPFSTSTIRKAVLDIAGEGS